jgi:acylphosphatase
MVKHIQIRVQGKVQGVFFRASAADIARQLNIKGFVRNEPDGSVYLEAEGSEENLRALVEWCRKGPPRARVDRVEVVSGPVQHFTSFDIQR